MNPATAEGHKQISEGEQLLQRASEAMERLRERFPIGQCIDGPRTMPPPPRSDVPATTPVVPSVPEMVEHIIAAESAGRWRLAALGLARLRESYEAMATDDPKFEQTWPDFARKNIPLARDRVAELIGRMVHRGAVLSCTKCGAGAKCPCGCGVPFTVDHPWANADPLTKASALERAAEAVAADPTMSDRALAARIGVSNQTIKRARRKLKEAGSGVTDDVTDERVGRDGRRRKVKV